MSGLGKTQLALQFAVLAKEENRYPYIFWVSAKSIEMVTRDFTKLGHFLCLFGRYNLDQATQLIDVRSWLEDPAVTRTWLIILDDVTQETIDVLRKDILPRKNCQSRILFTTRTAKVAESLVKVPEATSEIALQGLCIDDSVKMLLAAAKIDRRLIQQDGRADIESLIKRVGNLPLAIAHAAAYMKEYQCDAMDFLRISQSDEFNDVGRPNRNWNDFKLIQT
jgi:NB-ARC domain